MMELDPAEGAEVDVETFGLVIRKKLLEFEKLHTDDPAMQTGQQWLDELIAFLEDEEK